MISVNSSAARRASVSDLLIIASFAQVHEDQGSLRHHVPAARSRMYPLLIGSGVHMHIDFNKSAIRIFLLAAASYAIFISVANQIRPAVGSELQAPAVAAAPIKVENISVDYARAHADLMKTPDEATVNPF